jgi:nucleotide-binding universal stress UspA family protein
MSMSGFRKILVPIDGSAASLEAHRLAMDLGAHYKAEVILLYVVDSSVMAELSRLSGQEQPRLLHDMEESGRRMLTDLSRQAQQRGVRETLDLRTGMPDEIILSEAERLQVDLIVMGKIGRKGHRRSLLGSVTERVLEAADLPVLVVGPTSSGTASLPENGHT